MISFLLLLFLKFKNIDGGLKMRSWANGGTHLNGQHDHMSTLSRPRSIEAISNGTLPNNVRNCNGILSRASGLHEDSDFPPNYTKSLSRRKPIVWMRPHVSFWIFILLKNIFFCIFLLCFFFIFFFDFFLCFLLILDWIYFQFFSHVCCRTHYFHLQNFLNSKNCFRICRRDHNFVCQWLDQS